MKRAYKMRAYPTAGQTGRATAMLIAHCEMYNAALQERRDAWRMNRVSVTYGMQSAQLRAIRECCPDQAVWSFTGQQQTLRRLRRSFDAFFRRVNAGENAGYPRFKARARFDTVDHVNGDGAKWAPTEGRWAHAYFQGVGNIKVSEHLHVEGRVTQISLKREGRRWYVIVTADAEPIPLSATGRDVGIDVGIARFATTSDGGIVDNPRFLKCAADEIAELQRRLAALGGRSKTIRRRIAKLHRQVRNQRVDFHHKTARSLVDNYDTIAVEDLNVADMSRRAKPKEDGAGGWLPNGGAAKTGLNRSIADVGWAQFTSILTAKAEWAGRQVILVNPAYTSIDCHICGRRCTRPRQDTVVCPACGAHDADLNGAINVAHRAGLGSDLAA